MAVDLDKAIIAKYKIGEDNFEILVDCDNALRIKSGNEVPLDDVLATDDIYKDVKKGLHASETELKKVFGTIDKRKVALEIIKKGQIQVTTEHKAKLREEKKKRIIDLIHKNAIDPKTGLPHPPQRIELALEEAKVRIDEFKNAEEQLQEIVAKIRGILPVRFEVLEIAIKIPARYASAAYRILKENGKLLKDEWQEDGSLMAVIELAAGVKQKLEDELGRLTRGEVEFKIIKK